MPDSVGDVGDAASGDDVRAPMPGLVKQVRVAAGASIEPGTYNWGLKKLSLDLQGVYHLTRFVTVFANLRNVGNAPFNPPGATVTPSDPRSIGEPVSPGLRGSTPGRAGQARGEYHSPHRQ